MFTKVCVCVCVCVCVWWGGGSLYRAAANGSRGSWPIKPPRSGNPSCGTTHKGACVRLKSPSEHEDNLGGGIQNFGEEDFFRGELCARASTVLVR